MCKILTRKKIVKVLHRKAKKDIRPNTLWAIISKICPVCGSHMRQDFNGINKIDCSFVNCKSKKVGYYK